MQRRDTLSMACRPRSRLFSNLASLVAAATGANRLLSATSATTAAELCKSLGIKLYTIGMGTRGMAPMPVKTPFGMQMVRQPVTIDEDLLRKMAEITGGQYFRATDSRSLDSIYAKIDELEKTVTEQKRTVQAKDLSVESFRLGGFFVPPILTLAMGLLLLEALLSHSRWRTLP